MQKLILFRQQIESLNDEELNQCITSFGRNKIESLLFKGLFEELIFNKMDSLNKMNGIISQIKQCRKPKTTNNNNNNNNNDDDSVQISIKLNELPNVMISEISSFLQFSDQLQFEQANRAIFIGSRSSIKAIHSLNAEYFRKLVDFNHYRGDRKTCLHKLRAFNAVTIKIDYYEYFEILLANIDGFDNLFANIQQLTIHLPDKRGMLTRDTRVEAFNLILSPLSKRFDLSNIKALRLVNHFYYGWNPTDNPIDNGLISMMTRNSKLEYFECYAIAFKNDNYDFLKTVKGFAADSIEYSVMANMCVSIGDLQSLHIDADLADAIIPYISNYNLKELCLGDFAVCGTFIEHNMKCLERLYIERVSCTKLEQFDKCQIWINEMMKTLKYIGVRLWGSVEEQELALLDVLIEGLENVNCKKHRLKMRFDGIRIAAVNKLEKLINILSVKCENWMIICDLCSDSIELLSKQYDIEPCSENINCIIKNKGCTINGYHENWLMECLRCRPHQTPHQTFCDDEN